MSFKHKTHRNARLCYAAIMLCENKYFHDYMKQCAEPPPTVISRVQWAKEYICRYCGIKSRKELDINAEAARKFAQLRTEFWRACHATRAA